MTNLWHIFRRKRAEEALRKSDRRLRETQTIAQLGEWELDLTTNTLFWSEEIYRIFDADPARLTPSYETFLDLVHPDDRAMVHQAHHDSVKTRMPYEIVHRLRLVDGTIKFVRELCRTEYDQNGKPVRSIGAVQDITALKQVEAELRQAKAEADRANRAKSDFLSHMSHESGFDDARHGWFRGCAAHQTGQPARAPGASGSVSERIRGGAPEERAGRVRRFFGKASTI